MPFSSRQLLFCVSPAVLTIILIFILSFVPNPVFAAGYVVTKTADTNDGVCDADCSLREAISAADGTAANDTITFAVNGTFTLTQDLSISGNGTLTITGNGATNTIIDANYTGRVVTIVAGTVTLTGMTLEKGQIEDVGGGIYSDGSLTLIDSIVRNNQASGSGGAIYGGTVTVINSVFTGNIGGDSGAINALNLTATNSTIVGNSTSAAGPGGIGISNGTLSNTIIANNTSGDCFASGTVTSGNTLIGDGSCSITNGVNGNLTGDPALDSNLRLTSTSPAINAGNNSYISGYSTDLAGNTRVQQGTVDMGAYESAFAGQTVTVQFNAATSSAAEAAGFGNLLIITTSNSNPTAAAATVTVSVTDGTATPADYNRTGTITIPAGTAHNALVSIASGITVTNENLVEPNETLELTLSAPSGAVLGTQTTTTHTITNDDTATVTIADVAQAEGNSGALPMTFTVIVDNPVQGGFSLNYTTTNLVATTADNDYVEATGSLIFAGTAGESHSISVTINGDTEVEPDETFRVSFPSAASSTEPGSLIITDTAIGTISNDDNAAVTIAAVAQPENGTFTLTAILNNATIAPFSIDWALAAGTTSAADYVGGTLPPGGTLTFAGITGETQTFTIPVLNDAIVELNEIFTISMTNFSTSGGFTVNITDTASGTIINDDTATVTIADASLAEGTSGTTNMIFTATLDNAVQDGLTVNYATANGTASTGDNDYGAASGTLTFTGISGQTRTFTVTINGDTKVEADETFTVSLNTVSNPSVDITDTAIGTITNDDAAAVTIADVSLAEGNTGTSNMTFTATVNNAVQGGFTVNYATTDITASTGSDYANATGTLTFAGVAGETQQFSVTINGDTIVEPNETFTVSLNTVSNPSVMITDTAIGTITNDDTAGYVVNTTATAATIAEPAGSTTFTIRLATQPTGTVMLDFGSTDTTECVPTPASFTFNASNWNTPQTITITAADDLIADGTQPCAVTITRNAGSTAAEYSAIPNPANVTLSVTDDDLPGITVNPTTIAISESSGTTTFTLNANTPPTGNVNVPITTDGQCEVDTGSGFSSTESLTLPAGSTAVQTVTVSAVNDTVIEGAHSCAITTGTPTSATDAFYDALTATDVADVTANVTDNDVLHTLAAGAGGAEGTGVNPTFTFTITRSGATNVSSSVDYALGGSGVSGTDYVALNAAADITGAGISASATNITFAANATTATVTVTVNADSIAEPNFTLSLTLTTSVADGGAGTGTLAGSPASLTVTDDDVAGYIVDTTATAATIAEPAGLTSFTIRLATQPTGTVILDFGSTDTSECVPTPASFTFNTSNWNTPQTITITAADDMIADGTQPCAATISRNAGSTAAEYSALPNPANVTLSVTDNDIAGITVNPTTSLTTTEAGGTNTFTLVLNSQPTSDVTITATSSDTSEGSVSPSPLTFTSLNWNTAQTVTVTGVDDAAVDGNIAYTVDFAVSSSDTNYDEYTISPVNVTNTDDDSAGVTISPTSGLLTSESGTTATFTIVLNTQPSADVTIAISSSDTTEGTINLTSITFTNGNWNTAQTVTITGMDDGFADGDIAYAIVTAAAVSSDSDYSGLDADDVSVTNRDNDVAAISIAPTDLTLSSDGSSQTYEIAVSTAPSRPFTLALTFDPSLVTLNGSSVSPYVYTFTSGGAVTVNVAAIPLASAGVVTTITHAITSADTPEYPSSSVLPDVTVQIGADSATLPPPPPSPTCDSVNFDANGIVRTGIPDAIAYAINCRVLYQNGQPTNWLGSALYTSGSLGAPGLVELDVEQAIDIFSPPGLTFFNGGAVFCLRGSGTLIWLAASGSPRHAEIIGSYTVADFPDFTCSTLFEPGTLVLVRQTPN